MRGCIARLASVGQSDLTVSFSKESESGISRMVQRRVCLKECCTGNEVIRKEGFLIICRFLLPSCRVLFLYNRAVQFLLIMDDRSEGASTIEHELFHLLMVLTFILKNSW